MEMRTKIALHSIVCNIWRKRDVAKGSSQGPRRERLLHGYSRFAKAQDVLKIGVCIPMTGAGFNAVGRQLASAIKLYVEQHGDVVAERKIEIAYAGRWWRSR